MTSKNLLALATLLASCAAEQRPSAPARDTPTAPSEATPTSDISNADLSKTEAIETDGLGSAQPQSGVETIVSRHTAFAFDLHKMLPVKNAVYSPHSISTVLDVLAVGANGDTAAEINQLIRNANEPVDSSVHRTLSDMLAAREKKAKGRGFRLRIANGMWTNKGYELNANFQRVAENDFLTTTKTLDFSRSEEARETINAAVSEATERRIPGLIGPGVLDDLTRLVITNTVYFNAPWREPFLTSATAHDTFTTLDDEKIKTAFMNKTGTYAYASTDSFEAIELPYAGDDVVAWVVLPGAGKFTDVDAALSGRRLDSLMTGAESQRVRVSIPKFEIRSKLDLSETLQAMGMQKAFSETADFSKMSRDPRQPLHVSALLHEGFIRVDEAGTEAAAATAAVMRARGLSQPPKTSFVANRPFIFLVVDKPTHEVLFIARVVNPAQ